LPASQARSNSYSAREVGGVLVMLLGLGVMGSAVVVNPVVGRLWQGVYAIDKLDVLMSYCLWAAGIGAMILWLGNAFSRSRAGGGVDRALVIVLPLSLLVLGDRFLLVEFGLPLWTHDTKLHYRHRPDITRTLARAGRPDDVISINRYGHHDTDYPVEKPSGEFRGLMIGDSITMGDQLPYRETFSAKLETLLAGRNGKHASHEIINTGVHGYTTYQEMHVLTESMRFGPDFVAIGFCLNDLTDPAVVKRGFDGAAVDYHRVAPTSNPIQGYLLNDTGIGRLAQKLLARGRTKSAERRDELAAVRHMATSPDDPEVAKVFSYVLKDLEAMYGTARSQDAPVVLMIFPFTFQLLDEGARSPQQRLREHAAAQGVPVLDFTDTFAALVYDDPDLLALLQQKRYTTDQIENVFGWRMKEYFLDNDHLTPAGHAVVADALLEHLVSSGLVQ
jgi:lysophospholipase L1-like esterase